jgi:hypothetical protein
VRDLYNKGGFKIEILLLDVPSLILKGIIVLMALYKYGGTYGCTQGAHR